MESELRDGYKMTELGALPEEWKISTLGDVCAKAINGGTPSTDVEKYWTGAIPWITGADILSQTVSKVRRYITEEAVRDSSTNVIPKGNLLIVTRTGVGKLAIAPFDVAVSQDFTGVIPNDNTTTEYLFWLLNKSVNYFLNLTQGTSINGITRNDLMSFVFPLPPLPEQRRIATILSTLDETVEHTEALIEKYKNIKAGLMSDLLTRGIDEEGKIRSEGAHRFKDSVLGRVPEEWKIVKTKKLLTLEYGAGLPDRERSGEGYPVYGSNGIVGYHREYLINDVGIIIGRKGTIGSVTLTRNSFWPIDTTYYVKLIQESNIIWAYYLLLKLKLKRLDSSTGVPGLNRNDVYELKIPLPPLPEQRRIAEILTAADQRIEKEETYRDKLLQLKKGLMQDLLTGKVRVKVPQN